MKDELINRVTAAKGRQHDAARPEIVQRLGAKGRLTARERIDRLLDPDSAVEYGAIAAATQDGDWVPEAGGVDFLGTIGGAAVVTSSTDYTDHGGGYGAARLGRLFSLAAEYLWPVVIFVDGGGSRARHPRAGQGHIELSGVRARFTVIDGMAELSGRVPTVAIVSGPAFAGHASLAGFSDCLIATRGSSIGMGGPPMVEAALGKRLTAHELAGAEMHELTGGIDLLVDDEPTAIAAAKAWLKLFTERRINPAPPARSDINDVVPDTGPYDMHNVIDAIVDANSFMELRPNFSAAVITGVARIEGQTAGILASQPNVDGGAINEQCASKISRFIETCDAYEYPIVSLIDTPGTVRDVGKTGRQKLSSRWHARPLVAHQHRTVPLLAVQIRQAHGLGGAIMAGFASGKGLPALYAGWPGAETGWRDGYSALVDPNAFDDIITPPETRVRLARLLRYLPTPQPAEHKKHVIDTW